MSFVCFVVDYIKSLAEYLTAFSCFVVGIVLDWVSSWQQKLTKYSATFWLFWNAPLSK